MQLGNNKYYLLLHEYNISLFQKNMDKETLYKLNIIILVLVAWSIPWWVYNRFIRTPQFHPMSMQVLPTPHWMSCAIPYVSHNPKKNKCENVKIDGWSVGHVLIYFTLGMVAPGYWWQMLVLSLACETFEYIAGWRARWIIDPVANMLGYALGHLFILNLRHMKWISNTNTTYILIVLMGILLFLNRPSMIPLGNTFY